MHQKPTSAAAYLESTMGLSVCRMYMSRSPKARIPTVGQRGDNCFPTDKLHVEASQTRAAVMQIADLKAAYGRAAPTGRE
jgi:hypothetical protein